MDNRGAQHIHDDGAALLGLSIGFFHLIGDQAGSMLTAALTAASGWAAVKLCQHVYDRFFKKKDSSNQS